MSTDSLREALREAEVALREIRTFVQIETPYAAATLIELDRVRKTAAAALSAHPQTGGGSGVDPAGTATEQRPPVPGPPSHPALDRDAVAEALRKRLRDSNFHAHLHEPIRTQTIDTWVDVLTGAVIAVARPANEVKAEALTEAATRMRGQCGTDHCVRGCGWNARELDEWAEALRLGGVS